MRWLAAAAIAAAVIAVPAQAAPPANDDFGSPAVISGESGSLSATSVEATVQAGEPYHAGEEGGASVWFSYTVPAPGEYWFETCGSSFDTLLAIYTGDAFASLVVQGANDDVDCGEGSRVKLDSPSVGTVLRISVDDFNGVGGPYVLSWKRIDHAPRNTSPPTITGSPVEGQTLTLDPGTWTARRSIRYSYRWERCSTAGTCTFAGSGQTYVVRFSDVGTTMVGEVEARTFDGATKVKAAPTPPIRALPPTSRALPEIAGLARVGQSLYVTTVGGWDGAGIRFTYGWQRCAPDLAVCTQLSGAKEETLRLTAAELGSVVRVVVTATNSEGVLAVASAPTAVVQPALPKPCVVPRLRGKSLSGARKALARAGCAVGKVTRVRASARKGIVVGQSARPGRRLKPRARVGLVLSLGRKR